MDNQRATIRWTIGQESYSRDVDVQNNRLLLSQYYLKSLLPPSSGFLSFKALICVGSEKLEIENPSEWDIDGNKHYILDLTLSNEYVIQHSRDCLYISDSDCSLQQPVARASLSSSGTSNKKEDYVELGEKSFDIVSSEDEKVCTSKSSTLTWIQNSNTSPRLKSLLASCEKILQVSEIPQVYDGDIAFELPQVFESLKRMEGMEQRFDGHLWTRPHKTNMSIDCTVRLSYCLGSLVCHRVICPYFASNQKFNVSYFHGYLDRQVSKGLLCQDGKLGVSCHYCKKIAYCDSPCSCKVYYILPTNLKMTRLMVHVGHHLHEVQNGTCRATIERIRKMVANALKVDKNSGPRRVQMILARQMLVDAIVGPNKTKMGEVELTHILEEMIPLVQNQRFVQYFS